MKKVFLNCMLLICALVVGSNVVWGQIVAVNDVLWSEPFKGGGSGSFSSTTNWSSYIDPTTFVDEDKSLLTYSSANAMISTGSAGNMDGSHVWINKNTTGYFQIEGIKLYNTTKVKVSWAQAGASKITVSYAFDGGSSYTNLSDNSSASAEYTSIELPVSGHTTINLKFTRTSTNTNIRIDKLTLKATAVADVTPVITASDVNIPADVLAGNISYSITNPNGSTLTAVKKSGDWLTVGEVDTEGGKVAFTVTENMSAAREAVVTLTYGSVTKDVTITQTAAVTKYAVTYSDPSNGTLVIKRGETTVSSGTFVADGSILTIIATPSDSHGYALVKWQYKEGDGSWTDGEGTSFTINGKSVEFSATFVERIYHNVTYSVNGETNTVEYEEGEAISFDAPASGVPSGYNFMGWVVGTNKIDEPTDADPSANYVTSGTCDEDVTYYAVMAKIKNSTPASWTETALSSLTSSDIFVIVGNNGSTYALPNGAQATGKPSVVSVSASEGKLTGNIDNSIKWNVTGNASDGYIFYPYGTIEKWLYFTNNNTGVCVGTGTAKHFKLSGYLYTTETTDTRYLGIYSSQDWRCYTSTTGNIADQTFAFYKYIAPVITYGGYCTTAKATVTISSVGWATFSSENALDFTNVSGLTAYLVEGVTGTTLDLSAAQGKVPANTGLLLNAKAGSYSIPIIASADAVGTNKLVACTSETVLTTNAGHYVLVDDGGAVFQNLSENGATIPAGKAYLNLAGAGAPDRLRIVAEENNATGIENVETGEKVVKFIENGKLYIHREGVTYDAMGRMVK